MAWGSITRSSAQRSCSSSTLRLSRSTSSSTRAACSMNRRPCSVGIMPVDERSKIRILYSSSKLFQRLADVGLGRIQLLLPRRLTEPPLHDRNQIPQFCNVQALLSVLASYPIYSLFISPVKPTRCQVDGGTSTFYNKKKGVFAMEILPRSAHRRAVIRLRRRAAGGPAGLLRCLIGGCRRAAASCPTRTPNSPALASTKATPSGSNTTP